MSGKNQKVSDSLNQERNDALNKQNQLFDKLIQPSSFEKRFEDQSNQWDAFSKGGDYSKPPGILGYDLYSPSKVAEQTSRMANLEGVGASSLAGTGDNSIAVQQSRNHQAAEAAQNAGMSYENAVKQQDDYFKGGNLNYMNAANAKYGNLFSQTSQNASNASRNYLGYETKPSPWGSILGGLIGAAGNVASSYYGR